MKIDCKDIINNLAAMLDFEQLQVNPLPMIDEESKDFNFKSVLSDIGAQPSPYNFDLTPFFNPQIFAEDGKVNFNLDSVTKEDIEFFKLCAEKKEISINNINSKDMQVSFINPQGDEQQVSYKTVNFSKGLFNLIEYSFKAQKPVRLDFQGNSSVILKLNTEGKLTAEFISNDAAMEYALKSSLPSLRSKLDSQNIPYGEISYKDNNQKQQNNNKNNKRDKGENE